jgi:hypothetical protein
VQAAVRSVVDVQKREESSLVGQFVEVLNSKKDEIERLRREVVSLNEKLEAERQRLGRPAPAPTSLPAPSLHARVESDDGSTEDSDASDAPSPPSLNCLVHAVDCFLQLCVCRCAGGASTLPLASFEPQYQPATRAAHAPSRGAYYPHVSIVEVLITTGLLVVESGRVFPAAASRDGDLMDAALEEDSLLAAGSSLSKKPRAFGASTKRRDPLSSDLLESQMTVGSDATTQSKSRRTLARNKTDQSYE